MKEKETIAVVLFQLGGPDSMDAVRPFLYNLFRDPDIIDFPGAFLARNLLARIISARRSKPVGEHYREIGGKSPINELTETQAKGLEKVLRAQGHDAKVFVAMRYWKPFTREVVSRIGQGSFDRIVLLPLYPQFSQATTYSSMNEWHREAGELQNIRTDLICCYPNQPTYIEALVENINQSLRKFGEIDTSKIDLVFSAHGIPVNFLSKGDPYKLQIEETVRRTLARGKWRSPSILCYQSRVGRAQWLEPSLLETIRSLGRGGRRHLLVIPVSFVTEHIETLHEIKLEAGEEAARCGIRQFEMMPALNSHPKFIASLAALVDARLRSRSIPGSKCRSLWEKNPREPEPCLCPWFAPQSEGDHLQPRKQGTTTGDTAQER